MKRNSKLLRTLSALGVVALVCLGLALHTGTGTPSSWGIYDVAALCPLGAVEAAVASKTVVPPMFIAMVVGIVLVVLFGRAFCAWGCPIPLLRRILGLKSPEEKRGLRVDRRGRGAAVETGPEGGARLEAPRRPERARQAEDASVAVDVKPGFLDIPANKRGGAADSRNWVLGGTILSAAVFGFPAFCLVCPVGLTFATIIALWRLFQFNEVVLSLLVFPAILAVEVVVLRKWCGKFCPLGALLSLVARLNRTFRPVSDARTCLRTAKGEPCHQCAEACPEGIDLHDAAVSAPPNECTKCRACADACPMHAVTFPFLPKKGDKQEAADAALEDERVNG